MPQMQNNLSRLLEILEAEFVLLQTDNLDGFETLQTEKQAIVEELSAALEIADTQGKDVLPSGDSEDPDIKSMLATCRDHHIRNSILLEKKIEVNKNALNILRSNRHSEEVETYDKLGKVRHPRSVGHQSDV